MWYQLSDAPVVRSILISCYCFTFLITSHTINFHEFHSSPLHPLLGRTLSNLTNGFHILFLPVHMSTCCANIQCYLDIPDYTPFITSTYVSFPSRAFVYMSKTIMIDTEEDDQNQDPRTLVPISQDNLNSRDYRTIKGTQSLNPH